MDWNAVILVGFVICAVVLVAYADQIEDWCERRDLREIREGERHNEEGKRI